MTTVYMAANGKRGMSHISELTYHKSHYLASLIERVPGYSLPIDGTFFQEFVVQCPLPVAETNARLLEKKIIGGLDVGDRVSNGMLVCATEVNSREETEAFANALSEIGNGA